MPKINFYAFGKRLVVIFLPLTLFAAIIAAQNKPKLKPEEIVAKHLEAIGATEALTAAKSRLFQGKSKARRVNSAINTNVQGKTVLASSADKFLILMTFETMTSDDYAREMLGWDGKKFYFPLNTASKPTALGDFVSDYKEIIKQGLLGGTLMTNWALLDVKNKIGKFEYQGTDKIGSVEAHVLRCVPRGGSGLTIKLFFDPQTFRHLRTTYYQETSPPITLSDEGRVSSIRYKLVEDFENHKPISSLMLPTVYKLEYTVESPTRLNQFQWEMEFSRFEFNTEIKPELFQ